MMVYSALDLPGLIRRQRIFNRVAILVVAVAMTGVANATAQHGDHPQTAGKWIATWAAAAQPALPGRPQSFHNQTVRLIVHVSAGGNRVRIKLSNIYGDQPLVIGGAHIERRMSGAHIVPESDRALKFYGLSSFVCPD